MYAFRWLRSYGLMVQWQTLRLKPVLPFIVVIQPFVGVATVIGLGYLIPGIDPLSAMFFSTGAPTITLISLGLTLMPQMVAQAKARGVFDYVWALPAPRSVFMAADLTVWLLATVPGVIVALAVGSWYYGFELSVSPLVFPAFLLVSLTATAVGYAIAHLLPKPDLVPVVTNVIIFFLFLFSPINFPVERLPNWLVGLHRFLPFKYAADAVRGTLTETYSDGLGLAFAVLGVWCALGLGTIGALVSRRR
jgi:ABC-2 type transport system permease protein